MVEFSPGLRMMRKQSQGCQRRISGTCRRCIAACSGLVFKDFREIPLRSSGCEPRPETGSLRPKAIRARARSRQSLAGPGPLCPPAPLPHRAATHPREPGPAELLGTWCGVSHLRARGSGAILRRYHRRWMNASTCRLRSAGLSRSSAMYTSVKWAGTFSIRWTHRRWPK